MSAWRKSRASGLLTAAAQKRRLARSWLWTRIAAGRTLKVNAGFGNA